jgi:hypothetical protein
MRKVQVTLAAVALVLATLAVGTSPAEAHGRIPRGDYPCYTYNDSFEKVYTGYDLGIGRNHRYHFVGKHSVKSGTYRHARRGPGLKWTSGYLHRAARGNHLYDPSIGMNVIEILWNRPRGGEDFYHCFR